MEIVPSEGINCETMNPLYVLEIAPSEGISSVTTNPLRVLEKMAPSEGIHDESWYEE
jgi:hypothetical protein